MNEYDASESSKTVAGYELASNVPKTMSGVLFASSAVTWFTRPCAGTWGGVDAALGGGEGLAGAGGGVGVEPV